MDFALSEQPFDLVALPFANAMVWDGPVPAEPSRHDAVVDAAASAAEGVAEQPAKIHPKIRHQSNRTSPSSEDCADRTRVLENWCAVFEAMGDSFQAVRQCGGCITPDTISVFFTPKNAVG